MAGVPEEVEFATKPQQAAAMVTGALAAGIRARRFAADEVYCGRELRRDIRALNLGYTVGVPATHQVTDGAGRRWEARKMTGHASSPADECRGCSRGAPPEGGVPC
ncbi:transposase [Streptomyces sp. TLI_185]|uniref:transposase n=1 Tax=Streptomyces sp. TLI_185 TaxID=2485151 RepID=UPI0037DA1A17